MKGDKESSVYMKLLGILGAITAFIIAVTGFVALFPTLCESIDLPFCQKTETSANFTYTQIPDTYQISFVSTSQGEIVESIWILGDGETDSGNQVIHTYPRSGEYVVSLSVTDKENHTQEIRKTIVIGAEDIAIVNNFNESTDNWRMDGDSPLYRLRCGFGNSTTSLVGKDGVMGVTYYYIAPYKGDFSDLYGESMSFDLIVLYRDEGAEPHTDNDIVLRSGNIYLYYDIDDPSVIQEWQNYWVTFSDDAGWVLTDGKPASASQIQSILGDLDELRIRGEYFVGYDESCLDNVQIGELNQ